MRVLVLQEWWATNLSITKANAPQQQALMIRAQFSSLFTGTSTIRHSYEVAHDDTYLQIRQLRRLTNLRT